MEFTRPRRRHRGLDLTPLIDVVFLLIVFLILTASFQEPSLTLDLPSGSTAENSDRESVLLVELDAQGHLAVDGDSVATDSFQKALEAALGSAEQRVVRLLADRRVEYGELLPVIERIRASGAQAIDLVHDGGAP